MQSKSIEKTIASDESQSKLYFYSLFTPSDNVAAVKYKLGPNLNFSFVLEFILIKFPSSTI